MNRGEVLAILTEVMASAEVARRKMGPGVHSVGDVLRAGIQACASEGEGPSEPPPRRCATCKHVMRGLAQYPCVQCASEPGNKLWEAQHSQSVRTIGGGAGTASDLTTEGTISGLRARLTEAEIRAEELKLELSQTDARCELLAEEKSTLGEYMVSTWGSLDRAESIIHALCDERALARDSLRVHRGLLRNGLGADDPKGATDEDELLPLERALLVRMRAAPNGVSPATKRQATMLRWLTRLGYAGSQYSDDLSRRVWRASSLGCVRVDLMAKPARKVLPVGHVPDVILPGMRLGGPGETSWESSISCKNSGKWQLAQPFEVPND